MRATIMHTVTSLDSRRLTLLQGRQLIKYVVGSKLEIGMRHADIPPDEVDRWDQWISRALIRRADLTAGRIHHSATSTICDYASMTSRYHTARAMQTMEALTKPSELKRHYSEVLTPVIELVNQHANTRTLHTLRPNLTTNPGLMTCLASMASHGARIVPNLYSRYDTEEKVTKTAKPDNMCTFGGVSIPTRDTYDLWGPDHDPIMALAPMVWSHWPDLCASLDPGGNLTPEERELAARQLWGNPQGPLPKPYGKWKEPMNILSLHCKKPNNHNTYHHPDCPTTTKPKTQHNHTEMSLLRATSLGCTRSKCKECRLLWSDADKRAKSRAQPLVCTDGSTYPGESSAAALVFVEDDIHTRELWQTKGAYWPITAIDNHMAELSAINKAIRAVPIGVSLTIATDSLSSIQSVRKALSSPPGTPHLRMAGRPYVHAILRAIRQKEHAGACVRLVHVRSHTGARDPRSIGNAEADRLAKWMAEAHRQGEQNAPEGPGHANMTTNTSDIDLDNNDLPFCMVTSDWSSPPGGREPQETLTYIRGDIRSALKTLYKTRTTSEWASRPKRGAMIKNYSGETHNVIDRTWKHNPTSTSIAGASRTCPDAR